MTGFRSGRFQIAAALAFAAALAGGTAGCAGSGSTATEASESASVAEVQIDHDGGDTLVTLVGPSHAVFTAFGQPNPDRVIVDLVSRTEQAIEPVSVNDGLVASVTVSPYATGSSDEMTRVEVFLEAPAEHEVRAIDGGLQIRISSELADAALGSDSEANDDAQADSFDPWESSGEAAETAALEDSAAWGATTGDGDPWAAANETADSATDDASDTAAATTQDVTAAAAATRFDGVAVEPLGEGLLVTLRANGLISSVSTFTLDDPARLVVDLLDIENNSDLAPIDLQSELVSRIRVGEHADKIRVVVDGGSSTAPFDGRRVVPTAGGLVIALGRGDALETALAAATQSAAPIATPVAVAELDATAAAGESPDSIAPSAEGAWGGELSPDALAAADGSDRPLDAPVEAIDSAADSAASDSELAAPTSSIASIYGIEFDNQDNRDRIVVLGDAPVDYAVFEPSPETVIISLQGAKVDPEAAVRITPEPGGPVSLVTAFDQPEMEQPEVRLVVQRAANLQPEISRRGSLLIVDFPRTGGVAVAPPAMTQDEAMTAQADLTGTPATTSSAAADTGDSQSDGATGSTATAATDPSEPESSPASIEPESSIDLLTPGGLSADKKYIGRRISLDFKDVEIADVLRLIAEVSELNVIAGDDVKGKVTVRLVEVPWDQALDVVLLTKGLGFMRVGNILRIAPAVEIQQEEELRLQERRSKERLEDLIVKLQPVNFADVKEVSKMVKQLLTPDRGTVTTDVRTSTLIIKDIPSVIAEATALIKAIDTQTPQVLIEAKIVEAALDFSREFGVTMGFLADPDKMPDNWLYTPDAGPTFIGDAVGGSTGNPITANPTGLLNLAGWLLDDTFNVELQLQAAEINGDGKVISSPRVVTLDNKKATIQQGVSIPFQTFENGDAQLEFVDAVLKLDVTPHITANQSIIMKVAVTRNAPDETVFTLTGTPAIAKNEVKTETLIKDGQTLVLGGIYVIDKAERESKVPYLHHIPLLGRLFRSNEIGDGRKELLVFVTPRVVVPEGDDA
jgi:type IV pilus assembly protein PilQ